MNRKSARVGALLGLLVSAGLLAACVTSVSPRLHSIKDEISSALPETDFEPATTFHLGRISFGLSRGILRLAGQRELVDGVLAGVKRVDVAVYETRGAPPLVFTDLTRRIDDRLSRSGWIPIVRLRDDGEAAWVCYRSDGSSIRGFFVITLDRDELGLVRVKGRLDRALAAAFTMLGDGLSEGMSEDEEL